MTRPSSPRVLPDGGWQFEPRNVDRAERLARAGLCRLSAPGDPRVLAVLRAEGAVAAWESLRPPEVAIRPVDDLAALERCGGRLVCPGDSEWPDGLTELSWRFGDDDAEEGAVSPLALEPYALWVRGPLDLPTTTRRAVAVVGSRAATPYGEHVATSLGEGLAGRGWTVVSGAAFGIDVAAHRGSLAADGPTIAVLAGGVDVPYPRMHDTLLSRIARDGLLISEAAAGVGVWRQRFLTRNRIIAALAAGTVLVQAARRSGALNTVRHTRRLGRPVLVVPGPVDSAMSVGCHVELRRGDAVLVTSAAEIVDAVGSIGADLAPLPFAEAGPRDRLSAGARQVLEGVPARGGAGPAVIAVAAGVAPAQVLREIGPLVATGFVEAGPAGYRLTVLGKAPSAAPVDGG